MRKLRPRRYWVVGRDSVVPVAVACPSLKEAVTALVDELDRRAARRKATQVSWGDVIVPRVESWPAGEGKVEYLVFDASRPEGTFVGCVTETAPGKWQVTLTQLGLATAGMGPRSPSVRACRLESKSSLTSSRRASSSLPAWR